MDPSRLQNGGDWAGHQLVDPLLDLQSPTAGSRFAFKGVGPQQVVGFWGQANT